MRPAGGTTEFSPTARRRSPRQAAGARARRTRPSEPEAYGFVGSIAAVAAALAYLAWAYAPAPWLHHIGVTYYPNKRWAVAVPAFVLAAAAQVVILYVASNFLLSPPPASFDTISDEHARYRASSSPGTGADRPVEPISDIGIDRMNHLMFGDQGSRCIQFQEDGLN
ncbi:phosphatidylinositol N-acetylglucosaminyltransferase subunit P-like [Lolium rigidum]|uniref:phosphatidylinositol N-acetylglucosaminyltransferase subunit P-like n=1 Tax=Lolium rigidum TaxID=89674 RepID=UPI001F5D3768|nr:phosphatidylinositol N-acetylglucosaminyltransferase subunit P-like [Lolium rigidum]